MRPGHPLTRRVTFVSRYHVWAIGALRDQASSGVCADQRGRVCDQILACVLRKSLQGPHRDHRTENSAQ
eukprot:scaffold27809_cov23-Phaeocystis_antarctica.AAC.2